MTVIFTFFFCKREAVFINDLGVEENKRNKTGTECPWPNRIVCRIMVTHKSFILRQILPLISVWMTKKARKGRGEEEQEEEQEGGGIEIK